MRPLVDETRLRELARALGRVAPEPARLYLTGGATAVIEGWRNSTVDVDMRLEPELDQLLRQLPALKERLNINIELASPADFIPELPGWRERSPFLFREGNLSVYHFDLYSQALAKIERGFDQDIEDIESMIGHGLVQPARLCDLFAAIEANLYRYPAIEPKTFRTAVEAFSKRAAPDERQQDP